MENLLKIINTVRDNKNLEKVDNINPDMHLMQDLQFDSLDLAELTVRIEKEYNIDVFESGFVSTIGEIQKKLQKN